MLSVSESPSVSAADQEFLAQLVHRGFLLRADAINLLQSPSVNDFSEVVSDLVRLTPSQLEHLRKTKCMLEPAIPGYSDFARVGTGGTADVFQARRAKDFKRVALKILLPGLRKDRIAATLFVEEGKLLQKMQHPAIVRGHRVFKFMGTYILEMDFVPGRTLEEDLDEGHQFAEAEALEVILQSARALEYLRSEGLVHRDLKPGNIMRKPDGQVVLIDLGFAGPQSLVTSEGEKSKTTLGTPAYLAPEQAMGGDDLDARADIYSLGVSFYHLVVGELPFSGESDAEVMRQQILAGLKGGKMKSADISPTTHYLIEKMMAKDRDIRYANPAELVADIEAMQ